MDRGGGETQNTRWWESYLVRYFLGFIVGTVCIAVLSIETNALTNVKVWLSSGPVGKDSPFAAPPKPDWTAILIGFGLLGLGFCYLASVPITVMHAGRYRRGFIDGHSRHFWLGWALALLAVNFAEASLSPAAGWALVGIAVGGIGWAHLVWNRRRLKVLFVSDQLAYTLIQSAWFAIALTGLAAQFPAHNHDKSIRAMLLLGAPVLWIGIVQYFVLFRLIFEGSAFMRFYSRLIKARSKSGTREIRETYTHLREHSNSVFIVLIEFCLTAMLLGLWRITGDDTSRSDRLLVLLLSGLGIWMLPTVFMWARANSLELEFARRPDRFVAGGTTHAASHAAQSERPQTDG